VLTFQILAQIAAARLIPRDMVLENIWPSDLILWFGFLVVVLASIILAAASVAPKVDSTSERRGVMYLVGFSIGSLLLIVGTTYSAFCANDFEAAALAGTAKDTSVFGSLAGVTFLGIFIALTGLIAFALLIIVRFSRSKTLAAP
jgi:hypothetical protein